MDAQDHVGKTALHIAAEFQPSEVIKHLIQLSATHVHDVLLMFYVLDSPDAIEVLEYLVKQHGVDLNAPSHGPYYFCPTSWTLGQKTELLHTTSLCGVQILHEDSRSPYL